MYGQGHAWALSFRPRRTFPLKTARPNLSLKRPNQPEPTDPFPLSPTLSRPHLTQIMSDIAKVGAAIEAALGSAQDIEGVVDHDGNIYVVQTRPQV